MLFLAGGAQRILGILSIRRFRPRAVHSCLEPQVRDRGLYVCVVDKACHLAPANVKEAHRGPPAEFQSTHLAVAAQIDEREHSLLVELAVLIDVDAKVLPRLHEVAPAFGHACDTGPVAGCGSLASLDILDLRMRPRDSTELP